PPDPTTPFLSTLPLHAALPIYFFYQRAAGVVVTLVIGGGRMFPPFFREPSKAEFNKWALERVVGELHKGKVLVGFHPEGTRNKKDRKSTRLNSSHVKISYAVFC